MSKLSGSSPNGALADLAALETSVTRVRGSPPPDTLSVGARATRPVAAELGGGTAGADPEKSFSVAADDEMMYLVLERACDVC